VDWKKIADLTNTTGRLEFNDATNAPHRFYRLFQP
jgi:hypothetical protein